MRISKSYIIIFLANFIPISVLILFLIFRPSVWHIVALVIAGFVQVVTLIILLFYAKIITATEVEEDYLKKEKKFLSIFSSVGLIIPIVMIIAMILFFVA